MYDMPLTFVFGVLYLAFCVWRFVLTPTPGRKFYLETKHCLFKFKFCLLLDFYKSPMDLNNLKLLTFNSNRTRQLWAKSLVEFDIGLYFPHVG